MGDQMTKLSLASKAANFWKGRDKSGVYGLTLLVQCLEHVKNNRDWDALAVFVGASGADMPDVKRIIKAAFGDRLTFDAAKAKTHPTGVAFKMAWGAQDTVQFGNLFAFVSQAVEKGRPFNDIELQKALKSAFAAPKVEKDNAQLIELLAKAAISKSKEGDMDLHVLFKAAEAKAQTILKEAAQKAALKGK